MDELLVASLKSTLTKCLALVDHELKYRPDEARQSGLDLRYEILLTLKSLEE